MLWQALRQTAEAEGTRRAFCDSGEEITFQRLVDEAEGIARRLVAEGIEPGDRVAVLMRNGVGLARALCGVLARGAVAVPLHPGLRSDEIARCLGSCSPRLALVGDESPPEVRQALLGCGLEERRIVRLGNLDGMPAGPWTDPRPDPERAAFDLFSTGSTGRPKRVVRTHGMLAADAEAYRRAARLTPDDLVLGVAPLYHSYGISCVLTPALCSGAGAVLVGEFDAGTVLREISTRRCTIYPGSAFHFSLLGSAAPRAETDLTSLRLCFSCGMPLPRAIEARFRGRFGVPVRQMYGATECSSATMNLEGDIDDVVESAGRALPGIRVAVFTPEGRVAGPDEPGEVGVLGPAVARRYEDLPDLSERTFREGWFHSGDLGRMDGQGRLWITGRLKLMINVAGNKVDPLEVEEVLCSHHAVAEAAVLGVPGPHALEMIHAVIVQRGEVTAEELLEFCAERLVPYKVPRVIRFVEALPRSPTGKLLRGALLD